MINFTSVNYQLFRTLLSVVVLLGTCWGQVLAQHKDSLVVQVTNEVSKLQNLNDFLYILEDTTNALTFQQVRSPQGQKRFVPYTSFHKKNPHLKKKRAYWAKITFHNQSDRNHWILSSGAASYIELYTPTKDGKYQKKINGRLVAASKRDIKNNSKEGRYQFHIFLPVEKSSTMFINRIYSKA